MKVNRVIFNRAFVIFGDNPSEQIDATRAGVELDYNPAANTVSFVVPEGNRYAGQRVILSDIRQVFLDDKDYQGTRKTTR